MRRYRPFILPRIPIAKEAIHYLAACLALAVAAYFLIPFVSVILLILFVLIAFFYRDPERKPPHLPGILTSPADGKVIEINEVFEDKFLKDVTLRISIFLSLLDVHVVRGPISGKVRYLRYERGRYLPALYKLAPHENEMNSIGICNEHTEVLVTQVAGIIARRIVCYLKEDDTLVHGQRVGLIRLGSRVDIFVPKTVQVVVRKGQKVRAAETIIGRLKTE